MNHCDVINKTTNRLTISQVGEPALLISHSHIHGYINGHTETHNNVC